LERNGTEAEIVFYEAEDSSITDINEENKSNFNELGNFIISNLVTKEDKQASLEITVKVTTSGYMILKCRDKKNENDQGEVKEIGKSEDDQQISAEDQFKKYQNYTNIHFGTTPVPPKVPTPDKDDTDKDVPNVPVTDTNENADNELNEPAPDTDKDVPNVPVTDTNENDIKPEKQGNEPGSPKLSVALSDVPNKQRSISVSDDDDSDIPEY